MKLAWLAEPALLVAASAIATQMATVFARKVLRRHANQLARSDSRRKKEYDEQAPTLAEAIKRRDTEFEQPADAAVDSYFNQVVGTWAFMLLACAACGVLLIRHYLLETFTHSGVSIVGVILIGLVVLYIATMEPFGSESLIPYLGRKTILPPAKTALTWFRLVFFLLFALLTVAAYWPDWIVEPPSTPVTQGVNAAK